jgi:hypothetical protein
MWFIIVATLCSGAIASLSAKTLYQVNTIGLCDDKKTVLFQKPYFLTMAMFIGEACCLAGYYFFVRPKLQKDAVQPSGGPSNRLDASLLDDDDEPFSTSAPVPASSSTGSDLEDKEPLPPCPTWFFLALCCFDLTASTLNFVGLLWVSASLNQVTRS